MNRRRLELRKEAEEQMTSSSNSNKAKEAEKEVSPSDLLQSLQTHTSLHFSSTITCQPSVPTST